MKIKTKILITIISIILLSLFGYELAYNQILYRTYLKQQEDVNKLINYIENNNNF